MGANSAIEWTQSTWNPVTGCTKISAGCRNCYAERMARRLQAMGQSNYSSGFSLAIHEHALNLPLKWKSPRLIFANSMSDLFHHGVPTDFIQRAFDVMTRADWHQFQVLTKRSRRLLDLSPHLPWPDNIWIGVSVENAEALQRIDDLRKTGAVTKFLSLEPLLGPLPDLDLSGVDWVIVGGESGPGARPMKEAWVTQIRDQCIAKKVPFFFKQWGGANKKKAGRRLQGQLHDAMPPAAGEGAVQLTGK